MTIGGTAVSASAATAGIIDVAATGVTGAGWFAVSAIGAVVAVIGGRSLRRLSPFTAAPQIMSPPALVRRGAIGYDSVARYTAVRVQTVQVIHAIEPLHRDAAQELRTADSSVAPTLNELAERLRVLDEMARRMPGSQPQVGRFPRQGGQAKAMPLCERCCDAKDGRVGVIIRFKRAQIYRGNGSGSREHSKRVARVGNSAQACRAPVPQS